MVAVWAAVVAVAAAEDAEIDLLFAVLAIPIAESAVAVAAFAVVMAA